MNNNLDFQFGMYEPATDSVIINTGENAILVIRCKECNSSVIFDDPTDIVYLYRLAEEAPLLYAKLALRENGLQDYVDVMNEFLLTSLKIILADTIRISARIIFLIHYSEILLFTIL